MACQPASRPSEQASESGGAAVGSKDITSQQSFFRWQHASQAPCGPVVHRAMFPWTHVLLVAWRTKRTTSPLSPPQPLANCFAANGATVKVLLDSYSYHLRARRNKKRLFAHRTPFPSEGFAASCRVMIASAGTVSAPGLGLWAFCWGTWSASSVSRTRMLVKRRQTILQALAAGCGVKQWPYPETESRK